MGRHSSLLCFCLILNHFLTIFGRSIEAMTPTTPDPSESRTLSSTQDLPRAWPWPSLGSENITSVASIFGFSVEYESSVKSVDYANGSVFAFEGLPITMQLFGLFVKNTSLIYSDSVQCTRGKYNHPHQLTLDADTGLGMESPSAIFTRAAVSLTLPQRSMFRKIYFCLRTGENEASSEWIPQNPAIVIHIIRPHTTSATSEPAPVVVSHELSVIPLWIQLIFIAFLLALCGLMSGLNLGLMSITKTEMEIILQTGTQKERKYAARVRPLRSQGNQLLCCILLSNVMINATLATLVDHIISGFVSIIISTLVIVIVGEIVPQAVCMKHGLAVSAKTIYITKFFMLMTFPVAWPLGRFLDFLVGEETGPVYTRERLKELLKLTGEQSGMEPVELGIIYGALDMKKKTVKYKMRRLNDVFMLPIDTVLDYSTMHAIATRSQVQDVEYVPVFEIRRSNVVAVLHISQLILVNPMDRIRLRTLLRPREREMTPSLLRVPESTALDSIFKEFVAGQRAHIAFVHSRGQSFRLTAGSGSRSEKSHCLGVITMKDIVQQLLCTEIKPRPNSLTRFGFQSNTPTPGSKTNWNWSPGSSVQLKDFCMMTSLQFISANVLPRSSKLFKVLQTDPGPGLICPYNQNFSTIISLKTLPDELANRTSAEGRDEGKVLIHSLGQDCRVEFLMGKSSPCTKHEPDSELMAEQNKGSASDLGW